ncbi:hypothetical protein FHR92_005149, partial [Fontibacillus solani]
CCSDSASTPAMDCRFAQLYQGLFADFMLRKLRYKDKTFNFIVHYPAGWSSVIEETWEGTEERESNPDGGIIIYVESNKDDSIRVFGQHGHISLPTEGFVQEDFYTSSGEKGLLFSNELMDEKEIYFIMDSGFNGAHIRVSNDSFKRNEEKIMNVLRSIE